MTLDTPQWPVITWPVTINETVSLTVNGVTAPVTIANGGGYGFIPGFTLTAGAGSIADAVSDAVDSHTGVSASTATYVENAAQGVPWTYVVDFVTTAAISTAPTMAIGADSLNPVSPSAGQQIGMTGPLGTITATARAATPTNLWRFTATRNHVGYWAPYQLVVGDARDEVGRVFARESMAGAASVIDWGSVAERVLTFPTLQAAQLLLYRATDVDFAAAIGRSTFDFNNTLQGLIEAARGNALLRIYAGGPLSFSRQARILSASRLERVLAECRDEAGAGRIWSVSIPFRDLGGAAP